MINNQTTIFDVTYSRHTGNAESVLANKRAQEGKSEMRLKILLLLNKYEHGLTSKEIAKLLEKPLNTISGRFSELKADGKIRASGERRNGCAVLVLNY